MSQRRLAAAVGLNQSYLTFVLKGQRAPSRRLLEGTAKELGLAVDYFREYREMVVIERVKSDPALLNRVYALVTRRSP